MRASEYLNECIWEHPRDYGGFSPDGDYLIMSRHRDSDILSESNWAVACKSLNAEPFDDGRDPDAFDSRPAVYHFRAGHWAVGWIEYLLVRKDAPESILESAGEIICSLADYPVLDDSDFSEREWNAAAEYWQSMSIRERVDLLRDAGASIFAARRSELPQDDSGFIYERLTAA